MGSAAEKATDDGLPLGIIDLPADEYHADRSAVSKGWLDMIDRSPAHLKLYLDGARREPTPAMMLGSLIHTAVLEPDLLPTEYAVAPQVDRRTKVGKAAYAEWLEEHANMTHVTSEQMDTAIAVRDAVMQHRAASALLSKGSPEQTVVWRDAGTGEKCKARADWLRDSMTIDLKSTSDARPEAFAKSIANFRYDVQAAHYSDGFERDRFVFIAVEAQPPYGVAVYVADPSIFERGNTLRDRNLDTYSACMARNHWPGYEDTIQSISLPAWARS